MIAALFVETNGCYFGLPGVDPWDINRDARAYPGPHPVVAHPPCQLWVNFAALKAYRDSHGEKTPYRFKKSEFDQFWLDFQKEAQPWQGITSLGRKKTASPTARGGHAKGGKGTRPSTLTAVQTISEVLRSARTNGMKA